MILNKQKSFNVHSSEPFCSGPRVYLPPAVYILVTIPPLLLLELISLHKASQQSTKQLREHFASNTLYYAHCAVCQNIGLSNDTISHK
jgi:hypothetical protein